MKGRICMITGANSGIGRATALGLAEMGATIIMICRDKNRGENAQSEIIEQTGNKSVDLFICDLSSQQSIRDFVSEFKQKYQNLHVLINNAGVVLRHRTLTVDGIETNLAVNHLAPFLLTNLLLDVIKESKPSRIINVSSAMHMNAQIDFEDLQSEKTYRGYRTYSRSKLALMYFTYELSKKLENTGVTVNSLHPGLIRTNLGRDQFIVARWMQKHLFKSPKKGAETSIYLATSPEVENVTGKYFANKQPRKSSEESYNKELAKKMWEISSELTKLNID